MIMLNSPNNPTGAILSEKDIAELKKLVQGTDIFILSDEVYEHVIFDGRPHQSMLRYPELLERSFVCFSFGKVYHCTGWKIGYCVAPAAAMQEFRKVHQFLVFSVNTPMQAAIAEYLKDENVYNSLAAFFQQKRDHFREGLQQSRFKLLPGQGSYFQCVSYRGLTDEPDTALAIRITKEFGVASIPVSAFYSKGTDHQILRFCFAKKQETLDKAVERLIKI